MRVLVLLVRNQGPLLANDRAMGRKYTIKLFLRISAALHHLEAIQVVQTNYKRQLAQGRQAADTAGMLWCLGQRVSDT